MRDALGRRALAGRDGARRGSSSWAGRWALGAGGAVDLGESPADTLVRELHEEWAVTPERVRGEALLRLPHRLVMFVGQAWLAEGVEETVTPDHEHDEFAWWPREIADWPPEAGDALPRMATVAVGVSSAAPAPGERHLRPAAAADVHAPEVDVVHPLVHVHGAAGERVRRSASPSR